MHLLVTHWETDHRVAASGGEKGDVCTFKMIYHDSVLLIQK